MAGRPSMSGKLPSRIQGAVFLSFKLGSPWRGLDEVWADGRQKRGLVSHSVFTKVRKGRPKRITHSWAPALPLSGAAIAGYVDSLPPLIQLHRRDQSDGFSWCHSTIPRQMKCGSGR